MHELAEEPNALYTFPKSISPDQLPFHPVPSAPLFFDLDANDASGLHWTIADLGHGESR